MPQPRITKSTVPATNSYTVSDAKAFVLHFHQDIGAGVTKAVNITYGVAAGDPILELTLTGNAPINLLTVPPGQEVTVGDFTVGVTVSPPDTDTNTVLVNCRITNQTLGSLGSPWTLRGTRTAPNHWDIRFSDTSALVDYVICDPRAVVHDPGTVLEQNHITLVADDATGPATEPTVLGSLPPDTFTPSYLWHHDADLAILPMDETTDTPTLDVTLPGVYATIEAPLTLTTSFGTDGFLTNVSEARQLTISHRPQDIVLVLDRSGSMASEDKWTNAVIATRALVHLIAEARAGVNDQDRIGIVTFTDPGGWHELPISDEVEIAMPLTGLKEAREAINTLDLGQPADNTNIGDGLFAALDMLDRAGPIGDRRFTLVCMTDGLHNAGHYYIGNTVPDNAPPGAVEALTSVTGAKKLILAGARMYVIGLGSTIDVPLLKELTDTGFTQVLDPAHLPGVFTDMLHFSQEVNRPSPSTNAPDPIPTEADRVYVRTTDADRVVLSVITPPTEGTIALDLWNGATFVPPFSVPEANVSETDQALSVGASNKLPEGEVIWRVSLLDNDTKDPKPLTQDQVLLYEDLHLKAELTLDQQTYLTGDDMVLTVRIRRDSAPVLGAVVRAELDAPAVGLGEALSAAALSATPPSAAAAPANPGGRDVPPPAEQRIIDVMRHNGWSRWPRHQAPGLFADGTDILHDKAGTGDYSNTFSRVFKAGTYGWKVFADGQDPEGNVFDRQLTVSTVAAVKVDARTTRVKTERIPHHPSGLRATRITVTPQDVRHERLGPGHDDAVVFALKDGMFEEIFNHQPAPVFTDGTYQRVVLFKANQHPVVSVRAAGTLLKPIDATG
ncbi:vWA domain-containing protein [Streptomyces rhizosphaerihabitans]|uniref:vWA domain-containing protein n=1 Tax=Streptomyces rhizosphaerihabitans TaxID=1266770 RepID=UPI0021C0D1E8|nr:vWA domain-containing protein [Streptomyces rhizosphaerihabitans]MCT9003885.1 VWA domain-containing protein [Streptomyces rhizosphaerihabitans]